MVSTLTIIGLCFTVLCSLFLPIGAWIFLVKKGKNMSRYILLGMFGFFIAQIILRTPILMILGSEQWFADFANTYPIFYALFLSLLTALFETASRYIIYKYAIKEDIVFSTALGTGFGHGACETLAYVGITSVVNLSVAIMINTNNLAKSESYEAMKETLVSVSASNYFAAGAERLIVMLIHIGLSVILAYFIQKNMSLTGFGVCMTVHCIYDFTVKLISQLNVSVWITIIAMAIFAVMITGFTVYVKKQEKEPLLQIKK